MRNSKVELWLVALHTGAIEAYCHDVGRLFAGVPNHGCRLRFVGAVAMSIVGDMKQRAICLVSLEAHNILPLVVLDDYVRART